MKKRVIQKLRSRAGESIGETLVALLISSLALVMLAGAISAAGNMVTRSRTAMEQYHDGNAALANPSGGTLTVTLVCDTDSTLKQDYDNIPSAQNEHSGSTEVISYKK